MISILTSIVIVVGATLGHELIHFTVALIKKEPVDAFVAGFAPKYGLVLGIVDHRPSAATLLAPLVVVNTVGLLLIPVMGIPYYLVLILFNSVGSVLDVYLLVKTEFGKNMKKIQNKKMKVYGVAIIRIGSRTWTEVKGRELIRIGSWTVKYGSL